MAGGLAFLLFVWLPGFAAVAGSGSRWSQASNAFASRLARLFAAAILVGALVSVLGVLLQGASAAGVSLWSSLKGSVIEGTVESRFGRVWGLRALDWALLGGLLLAARAMRGGTIGVANGDSHGPGTATLARRPPRAILAGAGGLRGLSGDHPGVGGSREHREPVAVFSPPPTPFTLPPRACP